MGTICCEPQFYEIRDKCSTTKREMLGNGKCGASPHLFCRHETGRFYDKQTGMGPMLLLLQSDLALVLAGVYAEIPKLL